MFCFLLVCVFVWFGVLPGICCYLFALVVVYLLYLLVACGLACCSFVVGLLFGFVWMCILLVFVCLCCRCVCVLVLLALVLLFGI